MTARSDKQTGLRTGLIVLALVLFAGLGLLLTGFGEPAPRQDQFTQQVDQAPSADGHYLRRLGRIAPELAAKTGEVLSRTPEPQRRDIILQSMLGLFREEAPRLRLAPVSQFDALNAHFRGGVETLKQTKSGWCKGEEIEAYIRLDETELVPELLRTFAADDQAYDWALELADLYLDAIVSARANPVRHGKRTYRDKLILQNIGREMGAQSWSMALSIAAFSQAEGQGYGTMRDAIAAINVCDLGLAMTDLSDRLPADTRGRILSELLPETFYGNTPYALAVLTSFFFIG